MKIKFILSFLFIVFVDFSVSASSESLAPPSITYQPYSREVAENNSTIFYVGSSDADTYQWQVQSGGSWSNLSNVSPYSGVNTKLLALSSVNGLNDKQYRCIVSNGGGSLTSDPVRLIAVSSDLRINVGDAGNNCFISADKNMWHTGNDGLGTLRNIFTGTSANGNNPYQVKWSTGNSRWELRLDANHDGVYEVLTHYNSNASAPNPPNLGTGTWVVNEVACGSLGTFQVLIPTPGSLSAGDIAFVGFNSDDPDGFSFVALKDIPANEVINFTDHGWAKGSSNTWMRGSEAHFSWTAPAGGLAAGNIVSIIETSANVLTVNGGGSVGSILEVDNVTPRDYSLLSDNLFAYQGILGSLNPTFLTGLLADDNYLHTSGCDNVTTKWFTEDIDATNCPQMTVSPPSSGGASTIAPGLSNGVNAVMLNPFVTSSPSVTVAEVDNYKYNGTFSGTPEELAIAINDYNNWLRDNDNTYDINPSDYNGGSGFSVTNGSISFNSGQIDPGTGCDSPIAAIAENPVDGKQYAFIMVGSNASAVYKLLRYDGGSTWVTLGSFSPSDVPAPYDLGMQEVDLAISPDGTFHIAFTGQEDAECCTQVRGIWYASSSNGSSWSFTQLLTHPGSFNYTPILRIGSDDYPRMASIFYNASSLGYEARYSTYNGTTWNTETVFAESNGTNFLNALSFDLDATDKAHLAIQKKTDGSGHDNGLWYTTNAAGSWPANLTEIAPAVACCGGAPPFYEVQGNNPTIAIDGNNKVHIVHTDYNGNLQYVTNTSGAFASTPLNGGLIGNSHKDGLQILPNGNKFLSFKTSGALKYAYLLSGQSGNWTNGDAFVEASDFANYYYSNLSTGGQILYTFDRLASGTCGTGNPRTLNYAAATLPAVSEINIKGNGQDIADGDTSPVLADDTDFGVVAVVGASNTNTFTIENTGSSSLTLGGSPKVDITGTHTSDFTVIAQPSSPVSAAGSTTFQITFDPTAAGLREATVTIANDDADENPYTFAIQGTGINASASEINVTGSGKSINSGSTSPFNGNNTHFGIVTSGNSKVNTYNIENSGTDPLVLNGSPLVSITGSSDFSVTSLPVTPVSANGGSTPFDITFTPSGSGNINASVSIANDDSDENPYTFTIEGYSDNGSGETCNNGIDDDFDGLVDCYDPQCSGNAACTSFYYGSQPAASCSFLTSDTYSLGTSWSTYGVNPSSTPVVGDIDNDGTPEIVITQGVMSGVSDSIYIIDGISGGIETRFALPNTYYTNASKGDLLAIGDIDNDGFGEIIIVDFQRNVRAYEHNGVLKWTSSVTATTNKSVPALADFNQDGIPEVYLGNQVFDGQTGVLIGTGSGSFGEGHLTAVTVAADVLPSAFCPDCAGLELVAGNNVYAVNVGTGQLINQVTASGGLGDGTTSIVDFDLDGDLDAVVVAKGAANSDLANVYVWDIQTPTQIGTNKTIAANTWDYAGQAIVADFDCDGKPEIGVAGKDNYTVFDDFTSGMGILWSNTTNDASGELGSSFFDFDGNGSIDIAYRDEDSLYIFNGLNGNVKGSIAAIAGTTSEKPVIVDHDNDGYAEILTANASPTASAGVGSLLSIEAADKKWISARKVWNQVAYQPTFINDDLSIPRMVQDHSNIYNLNNFGGQSNIIDQSGSPTFQEIDASLSITALDFTNCGTAPNTIDITYQVDNASSSTNIIANTPISFYNGDPSQAGATLIITEQTASQINASGNLSQSVTIPDQGGTFELYAVVNDKGLTATPITLPNNGIGECVFTNNTTYSSITSCSSGPPEINIKARNTDIADGDTSPNQKEDTDFAYAYTDGEIVTHTFTIENLGASELTLSGLPVVSGTHSSDFTITDNPSLTIAEGESTSFDVTFNPSTTGTRNATITVNSDDADEAVYNFDIRGIGQNTTQVRWVNNQSETRPSTIDLEGVTYDVFANTYTTIQSAINAATNDDIVLITDGVYRNAAESTSTNCAINGADQDQALYLNITNKRIKVSSETGDYCSSSARLVGYGFDIRYGFSNPVTIQGLHIDSVRVNAFWNTNNVNYGAFAASNVKILRNKVSNTRSHGLKTDSGGGFKADRGAWDIVGNVFENIGFYDGSGFCTTPAAVSAMWLGEAGDSFVISDNIIDNTKWAGILCDGYTNLKINGNRVSNTGNAGIQIGFSSANFYSPDNADISHNTITNANISQEVGIGAITILHSNVTGVNITYNDISSSFNGLAIEIAGWQDSPDITYVNKNNFHNLTSGSFGVTHIAGIAPNGLFGTADDLTNYNFENNYWGDASGPTYTTNPSGTGEGLWKETTVKGSGGNALVYSTGDFDFTPFATSANTVNSVAVQSCDLPEINLKGNGVSVVNGDNSPSVTDSTGFGSYAVVSGSNTNTFTIENTGTATLNLNGSPRVSISGHTGDFIVSSQPASATLAASGSTTFQITFDPTATGFRQATVSIPNDDADESPYTFAISGTGFEVSPPTFTKAFAPTVSTPGGIASLTFTIDNSAASLSATSLNFTDNLPAGVLIAATPNVSTTCTGGTITAAAGSGTISYSSGSVSQSSTCTIKVDVTAASAGEYNNTTGDLTSSLGNSGTASATWNVQGAPEINIKGNSTSIVSGDVTPSSADHTDFGSQTVSSGTIVRTFTIENTGTSILNISSIVSSGTNAADFTVGTVPTSVASSGTATFDVTFDPSAVGSRTATITIVNDDADENSYTFDISGIGTNACTSVATTTEILTWTGTKDTNWDDACNWSPNGIPTATNDVIIPSAPTNQPTLSVATAVAKSVEVQSGATFTIAAAGVLTINDSKSFTVGTTRTTAFLNRGTVENNGTLTLGSTATVGEYGLWNTATFNNNVGSEINIDNSNSNGLNNSSGTFTNAAKIAIGANASVGSDGLHNQSTFNNNTGGIVSIDNCSSQAIMNAASSVFNNVATITIGANSSVGGFGIFNQSTFNNNTGGNISIDNSTSIGLANLSGTFTNSATLTLGANASVGNYGMDNRATFNNNTGGILSIDNCTTTGLYTTATGAFINSATLRIGANSSVGNIGLNINTTFNNNNCGEVLVKQGRLQVTPGITYTNEGFTFVANELSNLGTFTNNGVLKYGTTTGNAITNATAPSIIVNDDPTPIFTYGAAFNGTIDGIFKNDSVTSAGTFSAPNTFTPSGLASGSQTLIAKITPNGGGCTYLVPFDYVNCTASATISYTGTPFCTSASPASVTLNGTTGGAFTSSPAGLTLNSGSGQITPSSSSAGTYTVTYTIAASGGCPSVTATSAVTITALDDASFSYGSASYCLSASDPTPTITGISGGTFSSTVGLSINSGTGAIDVSASTVGTYTVTYTTGGTCSNSSTASVSITALDDASFSYGSASYCVSAADPTPTITGAAGGTFSSTGGLSINSGTGAIDVSASTPGTYTVTYTTGGICSNSSTASVSITALDDAGFNYASASYCLSASDPTPTITGISGGTFSSTVGLSINSGTGAIDVSVSTAGTYTVTYTTGGTCSNSSTASVSITALDDAGFNYASASYCADASDPTPTITGVSGGTFSSTAGLSINAATGAIDVSASSPGTYTVTYTTGGTCSNSSTASVSITALDDAGFSYGSTSYCISSADPTPTITGVSGGTFSSTSGLIINASTGAIDVSASTAGTYTVTYTTGGTCSNSSTASVSITALDDAGFNYASASYCVDATDPTPTITGVSGGTFISTAGLSMNSGTGAIDVSASTPGTYTVTYTTGGTCSNSSIASVSITALDDASFSYGSASYCLSEADPTPTITGVSGGTFSSTVGLSISSGTGAIDVSASTPGTYTVTYTTGGTCSNSSTASVSITALDNASFSYGSASYCVSASDPTPTITGISGGSFSSTVGLSINASTGVIDVSASTPGTYTVTYTTGGTCSNSSTASVGITALDDASFNYASSSYCLSAADPTPTITGVSGGTFSSTSGLSINAATGAIDVSASTAGSYSVTYTTGGTCSNSSTTSVSITALDNASFSYGSASYCLSEADPTPTIIGVSGGTFSSTAGLSINASTGAIDVSASTPGAYTVTYITGGTCSNSSTASVNITALDDASFSYGSASYCADASDPTPTITGVSGGTFSSTSGLSINAATGAIDVSASTAGSYSVTYTTGGTCSNSSTASVSITALDNASFSYGSTSYCLSASDPTPTITGAAGGTFSSTGGLSINSGTGAIDVSASTPGTYTVTYTTGGTCSNSSTASVSITALDDASFSYGSASYCVSAADPTPTITGAAGGTFSSTSGLSINASTGAIDVSASTAGSYSVTYTTGGTCPNSSTASVSITALDDASFSYGSASYCLSASDPTPTITGVSGGTFSSTAGLVINASTGAIDVSASTPGTYTVTYTTGGTCSNSSTASVTITALDDAGFNYASASYCVSAADPTPTITGAAGGTFSSTAGLSINSGTGAIDVSASTPGTHTVTYTTGGTCSNSSTASVSITALDNASFSYGSSSYCADASDPTPTITGVSGGTFSSTAGLSINAATGAIDVSASTPGTYTVTYTTGGTCSNSSTASVSITALDNASFNYSSASYCVSAADPTPTITGVSGGTLSSTVGLSINAATGAIDVSASTPGTYTVTYTTGGTCSNSSNTSVTINALPTATITGAANLTCAVTSVTRTASGGGTSSWSNGDNTAIATINAAGTYTVTVTSANGCTATATTVVTQDVTVPSISITGTDSLSCTQSSVTRTAVGTGTYQWSNGLGTNATASMTSAGTYTVTLTAANGCTNTATTAVVFKNNLVVTASNDGPYQDGENINLMATGGPSYSWAGPNGFTSSSVNPSIANATAAKAGIYTVTVNNGSCTGTATTNVIVSCSTPGMSYYLAYTDGAAPEVFSPLIEQMEVQVSNRPMTVLAVPNCELPVIESTRLQLSGTGNNHFYIDNALPFSLYEVNGVATGEAFEANYYTFIARGFDQGNSEVGTEIIGPDELHFSVVRGDREITSPTLSTNTICAGTSLTVSSTASGVFSFNVGNMYRAYLSDENGNFGSQILIGSSSDPTNIACTIPNNLPSGNNYKVVVRSSSPMVSSAASASLSITSSSVSLLSPTHDILSGTRTEQATQTVNAQNKISGGANVSYKSGNAVMLEPGFSAASGTVFSAKIENVCAD